MCGGGATSRGGERGGGAPLRARARGLSQIFQPEQSGLRAQPIVLCFLSTAYFFGLESPESPLL